MAESLVENSAINPMKGRESVAHDTPSRQEAADELRWARLEAEADIRPATGPCLGCGKFRQRLIRGRIGGPNVYCEICALATRAPSLKGKFL